MAGCGGGVQGSFWEGFQRGCVAENGVFRGGVSRIMGRVAGMQKIGAIKVGKSRVFVARGVTGIL